MNQKTKTEINPITEEEALEYEIASSWICGYAFTEFLKDFAVAYFIFKTKRRYRRYLKTQMLKEKLKNEK